MMAALLLHFCAAVGAVGGLGLGLLQLSKSLPLLPYQESMLDGSSSVSETRPDVVLVLGYQANHYTAEPSSILRARVEQGVERGCESSSRIVLLSGGLDLRFYNASLPTEADIMLRWVLFISASPPAPHSSFAFIEPECEGRDFCSVKRAIRDDCELTFLLERRATSTLENALGCFTALAADPANDRWTHMELITTAFHELRALAVFRKQARVQGRSAWDFTVPPRAVAAACSSPSPIESHSRQINWIREVAALALYWTKGWI